MIKVLIIDDEPLARSIIRSYLNNYPQIQIADECGDGFEGVKAITAHEPDLIFLDIQMPKFNGFEMLELIDNPGAVIFTTAFDEYAIQAFENNAVDYLLKPFTKERFEKALNRFLDTRLTFNQPDQSSSLLESAAGSPTQNQRIVVKNGGKITIIPVHDICYMEAADDYVKIITSKGSFLKNRTMGYFEKILDPKSFVRIHRSYLVNIQCITRIEPYEKEQYRLALTNGQQIPVSKSGYPKLKALLGL